MIKNVYWSSFYYFIILLFYYNPILMELGFSKNNQISNFMKIHPVGAELFHADGQTERDDEANSRFSQKLRKAPKNEEISKI